MGNFICAIIILSLIIVFTTVNSFIICNICDDAIALIDEGKTEEACKLWESRWSYIALFVRDAEMDVVNAEVKRFSFESTFEDGEAENGRLELREAIMEVRHSESASWRSIF